MVDNLIKGVLVGIFGYVWYFLGTWEMLRGAGYADDPGTGYMFFTILAAALLASGK
ncbi:MAG: hypothetical protein V3R64_05110 [Sphingomonadales bacterium]